MLKSRLLTAIVLLAIIFALIFLLKPLYFSIAISIFFIFSANEWAAFIGLSSVFTRLAYIFLVAIGLLATYFLPPLPIFYGAFILWLWAALSISFYERKGMLLGLQNPWIRGLCGLFMLIACWKGVIVLQAASPVWLLLVFVLIWLVDTGAFFAGRRWGVHPLAKHISPKKTWEGFWGGILLSLAVVSICSLFLTITPSQRLYLILLSILCAFFSVIGDLFVSLLKRQTGLKDSGFLLPGHGGILDRVDSTISTVPIFALGFLIFKL